MKKRNKLIILIVIITLMIVPMFGCGKNALINTLTRTPVATPTPLSGGPYQDVVLIGLNTMFMSPHNWRSNLGTQEENSFWWNWNVYDDLNSETKKGCKYFTIDFKEKNDKYKRTVYEDAQKKGIIPYVLDLGADAGTEPKGRAKNLDITMNFPAKCKKVYMDMWIWDFPDRPATGGNADWITNMVAPDMKAIADKIKTVSTDVEVYIGGCQPFAESFPRNDKTLWPDNGITLPVEEHERHSPERFAEMNAALKVFCDDNGYKFVDYSKSDFVTATGWAKEEYMTPRCHGGLISAAGLKVYADYLMDQMGLPKKSV